MYDFKGDGSKQFTISGGPSPLGLTDESEAYGIFVLDTYGIGGTGSAGGTDGGKGLNMFITTLILAGQQISWTIGSGGNGGGGGGNGTAGCIIISLYPV